MNAIHWILLLSLFLSAIGILGCILPGIPGHPINLIALMLVQWALNPFTTTTLVLFTILSVIILVLDFVLPIWFAKKYGATKLGIWGSIIGMIFGIFFTPIGMMLGMLLGAILGDILSGRKNKDAMRSGFATFFGTILSIGLKLGIAGWMSALVFFETVKYYIS